MDYTIFKEALNELLDRPIITLLVYTNKKFWHYKRLAKKLSENFQFTQEELEFFKLHGLENFCRTDLYYLNLREFAKSINNYEIEMFCNYYFYDLIEDCKNDAEVLQYYKKFVE